MTCNYESEYITDYDKKNEEEVNFKICHYISNLIWLLIFIMIIIMIKNFFYLIIIKLFFNKYIQGTISAFILGWY